jgi:AcrR family transcriptional regulator
VNKRILYHYFDNKEGLYRAALCGAWRRTSIWSPPRRPIRRALPFLFARAAKRGRIRLLQWKHWAPAASPLPRTRRKAWSRAPSASATRTPAGCPDLDADASFWRSWR